MKRPIILLSKKILHLCEINFFIIYSLFYLCCFFIILSLLFLYYLFLSIISLLLSLLYNKIRLTHFVFILAVSRINKLFFAILFCVIICSNSTWDEKWEGLWFMFLLCNCFIFYTEMQSLLHKVFPLSFRQVQTIKKKSLVWFYFSSSTDNLKKILSMVLIFLLFWILLLFLLRFSMAKYNFHIVYTVFLNFFKLLVIILM